MITIDARLRAAARQHRGSSSIVSDLYAKLSDSRNKKQDAEYEILWCEGHIEFQKRDAITEYQGELKVYEIDDGETHMVSAQNEDAALEFYAVRISGYESVAKYREDIGESVDATGQPGESVIPVYDVDDTGKLIVKTAAEWANTKEPQIISTTVY